MPEPTIPVTVTGRWWLDPAEDALAVELQWQEHGATETYRHREWLLSRHSRAEVVRSVMEQVEEALRNGTAAREILWCSAEPELRRVLADWRRQWA